MSRYVITDEDRRRRWDAARLRRDAELDLLNRLLAEAAMPERYPYQ